MKARKVLALILTVAMLFCSLSGFTYKSGLGNTYYTSEWDIFQDAKYTEIIGEHSSNGIEHAHVVEANMKDTPLMPVCVSGEVHSVQTVGSMVKYYENQGYHVVAAINGDIYDTSTGTPKGTVIRDGKIVTSGYAPDRVWAFDEKGVGSIRKVDLSYSAHATIEFQWPAEHTNEEMVPVERVVTVTREAIDANGMISIIEEQQTITDYVPKTTTETVYETITNEVDLPIGFFNVPHGGANALHLYNRHYGTSTHTKGVNAEAIIKLDDIQLGVNKTIKGTVQSVNPTTANTAITDNTVVLSTVQGSATYEKICCLKPGSEIEISCTENGGSGLDQIKDCMGFYYSIVENGRNATSGTNVNPRTALGVKADGTLVMAEVDGRTSVSKGLNLPDLANFMIDLGCTDAVNMDGGGSSVIYVRKAGLSSTPTKLSTPSGGSERKVSNVILLVYKERGSSTPSNLHINKSNQLVMPGASVNLTATASNSLYESTSLKGNVTYSCDKKQGTISGSVFTAGETTGNVEITGNQGSLKGSTYVTVVDDIIIKPAVSKLTVDAGETKELSVKAAYGTANVNLPVNTKNNLFTWSCDESIGTITNDGVFTATSGTAKQGKIYIKYGTKSASITVNVGANMLIYSDTAEHWAKEYIGVLAGQGYLSGMGENRFAPDEQLTRAQFVAMLAKIDSGINPPASSTSQSPYEAGDISDWLTDGSGSGSSDMNAETTTPIESGESTEVVTPAEPVQTVSFTDVSDKDWFAPYVTWAVNHGVASGMGDGTFAPNAPITREQMAIMLCKYAASINYTLPQIKNTPAFTDSSSISEWALDYVITAARAGIINGFDTGEFSPQGAATRAQAATIIYKLSELYGLI